MSRYQWPDSGKSKDRPFQRMRHNMQTDGVLLTDAVIAAHELRAAAPDPVAAPFDAPSGDVNLWVPIGPSAVMRGQAGSRPRVAGRVRDLAVSNDGQRAYAATANGGVWYSGDAGNNWSPLGNWIPTPVGAQIGRSAQALTCGCLLVKFGAAADGSADDGSADDVYVGTGELRPTSGAGTPVNKLGGVGVLHLDKPLPQVLADPFGNHWKREANNLTGYGIYRLARDPADANRLVAATSIGLFTRGGPFAENADWVQVKQGPFDFNAAAGKWTTDALWVNAGGTSRLWVALQAGGDTGVWLSANGVAGPFEKKVSSNQNGRLGLAAAPSDQTVVYALGQGPRLWRISGVTPTEVLKLPSKLFGDGGDQSGYDLAVAVHPDNKDVVAIGGSTVQSDGEWSASLFKCTVTAAGAGLSAGFLDANQTRAKHADDNTYIGNGVHADIHQIRFIKTGAEVHAWVGCDGGVFRSRLAGDRHSFVARNAGLAILETGYLASHPDNDAFVMAGTQDNGALQRVGDTVWMHSDGVGGDGGGVMFHPVKTRFFAAQYTRSDWNSNGRLTQPVLRGTGGDSEKAENGRSSFYSGGDLRRVGATSQVRLAIGTNRVWLADNWDPEAAAGTATAWVTLPGKNDPRSGVGTDELTDTHGERTGEVIACRWMDEDRLLVLMQSTKKADGQDSVVRLLRRKPDNTWEPRELSKHVNKCSDYSNGDISQPTSDHLPPLGAWSDLAVQNPAAGSFYVACTGHVRLDGNNLIPSDRMDTLWWYDGTSKWYPTGLRNQGTKAPAYAVLCDGPDTVYVGTALGVWRGVLTMAGTTPGWTWGSFSNGLPEAAVQDLSLYNNGLLKILRVAIQARGIWEADLSAFPSPTRRTYLRVHANDARRADITSLANPMKAGPPNWPWHASPDVRIRPAPLGAGEAIPRPPDMGPMKLPWTGSTPDPYLLWVFQTALHKIDPLCRANGQWTEQFTARLRAQDAAAGNTITGPRWTAVVTAANLFSDPWDGTQPTEADLFELVVEDPTVLGVGPASGPPEISHVKRRKYKVDVLVHYRDPRPLAAGDVRVTLLSRQLPADAAEWPAIAISAQWKTRVEQLMSGAPPAGWSLPDNWLATDAASRTRTLPADIDARTPRAATFDVNFSGVPRGRRFVLLAIAHSTPDPVTTASLFGDNLRDLILKCHQVAARVVEVRR